MSGVTSSSFYGPGPRASTVRINTAPTAPTPPVIHDNLPAPPAPPAPPPSGFGGAPLGFDGAKWSDPSQGTSHKYVGGRIAGAGGSPNDILNDPMFSGWNTGSDPNDDKIQSAAGSIYDVSYDYGGAAQRPQWQYVGGGPAGPRNDGIYGNDPNGGNYLGPQGGVDPKAGVNKGMLNDGIKGNYAAAVAGNRAGVAGSPAASGFNEAAYLAANPDVAKAVQAGWMPSGQYHWTNHGQKEGRSMGAAAQPNQPFDGGGIWQDPAGGAKQPGFGMSPEDYYAQYPGQQQSGPYMQGGATPNQTSLYPSRSGLGPMPGLPASGLPPGDPGRINSNYTSQFNDPATQQFEQYLSMQMQALEAQRGQQGLANAQLTQDQAEATAASNRLVDFLQQRAGKLQGPAYTGTEQEILRTQMLDPIERDRTAANQRALENIGSRGFDPTSGIAQQLIGDVNQGYDQQRAAAQGDLAYKQINEQRSREQEAQMLLGMVPGVQSGSVQQNLRLQQQLDEAMNRPRQDGMNLSQMLYRLPAQAQNDALAAMGMGGNGSSPDQLFNQSMQLYTNQQDQAAQLYNNQWNQAQTQYNNQLNQYNQSNAFYQQMGSMMPYLLGGGR